MSKTIENLKSGNYEIVDNQGVSVTNHFIECLEKELANCIEPKFKIGQVVYVINPQGIFELKITSIRISQFEKSEFNSITYDGYFENEVFASEEEAEAKLGSLKNG